MSSLSWEKASGEPAAWAPDTLRSVRNTITLGGSLLATWTVALGIRLVLPRHLGPESFGAFQFADAFTAAFFVVTSLGVETYIRKEVTTRKDHASEFFGGLLVLRIVMSVVLVAAMMALMTVTGRPLRIQRLVLFFAAYQFFFALNGTSSALLHAVGAVEGLALLNVVTKLVWAAGILGALSIGAGVEGVAVALAGAEALKAVALLVLARRHLDLSLVVDLERTLVVVGASLPFYLHYLAHSIYGRLDISLMSFLAGDAEVGWYGVAQNVAGLALLITPLIGWVLLPMLSQAAACSEQHLDAVVRRALEAVLSAAAPVTLLLALEADVLIPAVFGSAFTPAVPHLRILAPLFILTYTAMVGSMVLIRLERGWAVTAISVSGLGANALLNWFLIPACRTAFGPGGAGIGAAWALVATEASVTALLLSLIGRRAFDRRSLTTIAKTALACLCVLAAHRLMAGLGGARIAADALLYFTLVVVFKAVRINEVRDVVRMARRQRDHAVAS
jgi:O-antigen/teichoic acid export membrane protein